MFVCEKESEKRKKAEKRNVELECLGCDLCFWQPSVYSDSVTVVRVTCDLSRVALWKKVEPFSSPRENIIFLIKKQ